MRLAIIASLLLAGCATLPPVDTLAACAAYELQLTAAQKAVHEGRLYGQAAADERARLEALPERAACLGVY